MRKKQKGDEREKKERNRKDRKRERQITIYHLHYIHPPNRGAESPRTQRTFENTTLCSPHPRSLFPLFSLSPFSILVFSIPYFPFLTSSTSPFSPSPRSLFPISHSSHSSFLLFCISSPPPPPTPGSQFHPVLEKATAQRKRKEETARMHASRVCK